MLERKPITTRHYYEIEEERTSESALVLFVRHTVTNDRVVMKLLREFRDIRYSLMTVDERQHCQLEALHRNRKFTPGIFMGLAQKLERHQGNIVVGNTLDTPSKDDLYPGADYVLVMNRLPDDRRLDELLNKICALAEEEQAKELQSLLHILTEYIVYMHRNLVKSSIANDDGIKWGNFEQLQSKLKENITFLDEAFAKSKKDISDKYSWLRDKDSLLQIPMREKLRECFQQRVQKECIKRCHGDLKSPNIWIMPFEQSSTRDAGKHVKVLDAVDFNESFCNIDILSDFALLVVDIYARTKSSTWASFMIEEYLQLSKQQDEVSETVLAYYLFEKAIVSAAVSINDEINLNEGEQSEPGKEFLDIAEIYLKELENLVSK